MLVAVLLGCAPWTIAAGVLGIIMKGPSIVPLIDVVCGPLSLIAGLLIWARHPSAKVVSAFAMTGLFASLSVDNVLESGFTIFYSSVIIVQLVLAYLLFSAAFYDQDTDQRSNDRNIDGRSDS